MNWQDLFYFSKGERRAFGVLICLIFISWTYLFRSEEKPMPVALETDACRPAKPLASNKDSIVVASTLQYHAPSSTEKKVDPLGHSGLPTRLGPQSNKFPAGTVIELNTADSLTLKRVPGIGPAFARRIVKYRDLLGGFYTIRQLAEVYGIDEERYAALSPWFRVDTTQIRKLQVNQIPASALRKHPYISYQQARTLEQLRIQKSRLSGWENLLLIEEFTDSDKQRLLPYLSFQ